MKRISLTGYLPAAALAIGIALLPGAIHAQPVVAFEDLTTGPQGYWKGADGSGGFTSGGLHFNNHYDPDWGSWDGWAYSQLSDMTTPGYLNQFSAYSQSFVAHTSPGPGADASATYAVACLSEFGVLMGGDPPTIRVPPGKYVSSAKITNTTYAYLAIKDGNDGNDPPYVSGPFAAGDFFKLTVTGKDADGAELGTISYYLADLRPADQREDNGIKTDYILNDWTALGELQPLDGSGSPVDITALAGARTLEFLLDTSDRLPEEQQGWANTPLYFAMDSITVVAEPATVVMLVCAALCLVCWRRRHRTGRR